MQEPKDFCEFLGSWQEAGLGVEQLGPEPVPIGNASVTVSGLTHYNTLAASLSSFKLTQSAYIPHGDVFTCYHEVSSMCA